MIDWGKDYNWKRRNRKSRQWGRHGHDRVRWIVNQAFRTIDGHYYYGQSEHADRKWRALNGKGWGKP